jgi:Flp pilus assembly protein TadD
VALALLEECDRAGKAGEAEQLIAQASRAHPGNEVLLYALGNAQDRQGQRRKALGTMRKVLTLQPAHAGALNYIGYTLVEENEPGDLAEAEPLLQRAVDLRPDDGAIADSYGYCLFKLGRIPDALAELQRADRLSPGDPVILSHLGDALLGSGKKAEALSAFRHALSRLQQRRGDAGEEPKAQASGGAGNAFDGPEPKAQASGGAGFAGDGPEPKAQASIDPPDRLPEPEDAKVRAELQRKLRALSSP